MKLLTALCCCVCFFSSVQMEAAPARGVRIYEPAASWDFPELVSPARDSLLFSEPVTTRNASRSFYYTGVSFDGYVYVIQVFHWHYGWFDGWGVTILASDSNGNCYVHEGRISDKDLTESKEALSIRFGGNLVEDEGDTSRILLATDGFRCDLVIRSILPPWTPGNGYALLVGDDDIYMRKAVPVPLATTSGTLQIGNKTISAKGWCYGDRSLIVAPPGKLNFTGCAFRVFGQQTSDDEEPWMLALLDYTSVGRPAGLRIPMLLMAHGREWILTSKEYQITCEDLVHDADASFSYPSRIHLSVRSRGYSLEGDYICDRLVATTDVFDNFPGLLRAMVSVFLKRPIIFRMVGHFEGTLAKPDGSVERLRLAGEGDYFTVR
ncbi:MAG: hypothetical protein A2177_10945 [Spirochaetes bacterium RBG_13_68_11]|nr:MAG: hypothetical protein A2177_10945 [Spirochaetes bacterium RBG_13_68_11]